MEFERRIQTVSRENESNLMSQLDAVRKEELERREALERSKNTAKDSSASAVELE